MPIAFPIWLIVSNGFMATQRYNSRYHNYHQNITSYERLHRNASTSHTASLDTNKKSVAIKKHPYLILKDTDALYNNQ